MKIIRLVSSNFKKILTSPGFYACISLTVILCFCSEVYFDAQKMQAYSVISVLIDFDRKDILTDPQLCSFAVFSAGNGTWVLMFIPIVAAFAFVPLLCDGRESKALRYSVFRTSKWSFSTGNFLTAFLAGGFAVVIGFIIFGVCIFLMFPNISEYSTDKIANYESTLTYFYPDFLQYGYPFLISEKILGMFAFGAVSAIPAFFLTGFMKNKYLIICIPFFVKYALMQSNGILSAQAFSNYENPNTKLLKILSITDTNALGNLFDYSADIKYILLFNGIVLCAAYFIYCFLMNRRLDYGE